ncbi:AraC family transcriptional regulator [Luteibacter aegosomatis]|uniref:helix-turn-helix domain-containing protein n=1 Tax=Luteibacter aegosomatis TaxID=2911537 RepID=UPI001FFAAA67|nr:AraC family transcriptional regulator [Luteibacter aegosomatis]UPG83956.1 AraC family transcriptional regulator [Luteibacter aegosomatis]
MLSGSYTEAGDRGRVCVSPGDVVFHGAYESHRNDVSLSGADVLVVPWHGGIPSSLGRIDDVDAVVRAFEKGVDAAARAIAQAVTCTTLAPMDWPDRLADAIRCDPFLHLETWAERHGLRPETVSRGFRKAYGVTAVAYRARIRTLRALDAMASSRSLVQIAADCGFSDQAHLTRSFSALTDASPSAWRRRLARS